MGYEPPTRLQIIDGLTRPAGRHPFQPPSTKPLPIYLRDKLVNRSPRALALSRRDPLGVSLVNDPPNNPFQLVNMIFVSNVVVSDDAGLYALGRE